MKGMSTYTLNERPSPLRAAHESLLRETHGEITTLIRSSQHSHPVDVYVAQEEDPDECGGFYMHVVTTFGMHPHGTELSMFLSPMWPTDPASLADERHAWPFRLLQELGQHPWTTGEPLGHRQLLYQGQPYGPGTDFCGVLLGDWWYASVRAAQLGLALPYRFLDVTPLYRDEVAFALTHGPDALDARLSDHGVLGLLEPDRPSVVAASELGGRHLSLGLPLDLPAGRVLN